MKKCSKCGETKPLDEFHKDKNMPDGLKYACKSCVAGYNRTLHEKMGRGVPMSKHCHLCNETKISSEFYKKKSSIDGLQTCCKICTRNQNRRNYHSNIEQSRKRVREQSRKTYSTEEGRDRLRKNAKRWVKSNPEKVKAIKHNRRAESVGRLDPEKWKSRLDYYGGRCVYCRTDKNITIEHRIPISRGGTNLASNLVPACSTCNCRKNNKTETEFKLFLSQEQAV